MVSSVPGKKVFFIYPHSVIQKELIQELVNREYEVYLINDHRKIESICENYNSPIIFINIDEGLIEQEWELLVRSLMVKQSTKQAMIGILTYNNNPDLIKKYLLDIMIPCGFIQLKLGLNESTEIILKTLEVNEVKGNRTYLQTKCNPDDARFNIQLTGKIENGSIIDISSIGMTVIFDNDIELSKNTYFQDLQLKLKGILLTVSAVVLGFRNDEWGKTVYLLMFDNKMPSSNRSKIRTFIYKTLQQDMEKKLGL